MKGGFVFADRAVVRSSSPLHRSVLMLNAHYMALRVVSVRRAFTLLFKRDHARRPLVEVVSWEQGQYVSYDYDDWAEFSIIKRQLGANGDDWVRTVRYEDRVAGRRRRLRRGL